MSDRTNASDAILRLADRGAIADILFAYAHGIDRRDPELVLACFHEDAFFEHGGAALPVAKFFELSASGADGLRTTMHHLTNVTIDVEADEARTQAYLLAYHLVKAEGPDRPPLFPCLGRDYGVVIGGRYFDRFARRNGVWRIAHRKLVFDWSARIDGPAFPIEPTESGWTPSFGILGATQGLKA